MASTIVTHGAELLPGASAADRSRISRAAFWRWLDAVGQAT